MDVHEHYAALFSEVEKTLGPVSNDTHTAIIGFTAGGPISICRVGEGTIFVTVELSLNPEQKASSEGLKYELMSRLSLSMSDTQSLLTNLGGLSLDAVLGDRHTIDIGTVTPTKKIKKVRLSLHSSCVIGGSRFGVYEVYKC
jgi:hypothetical protein